MRLFIALPLPTPVKASLARTQAGLQARAGDLPLRWPGKPLLHLTLHFLGDYPEDAVETLAQCMERATAGLAAFTLHLDRLGAFPAASHPQVLWIGVAASAPLTELQQRLGVQLTAAGFRCETRPFQPHITLARCERLSAEQKRRCQTLLAQSPTPEASAWLADRITLYHSHHDDHGLHYSPVAEARLGHHAD